MKTGFSWAGAGLAGLILLYNGNWLIREAGALSFGGSVLGSALSLGAAGFAVWSLSRNLGSREVPVPGPPVPTWLPKITIPDAVLVMMAIAAMEMTKLYGTSQGQVGSPPPQPSQEGRDLLEEVSQLSLDVNWSAQGVNTLVANHPVGSAGYNSLLALCNNDALFHTSVVHHGEETGLGWPPADAANDPGATGFIMAAQGTHIGKFEDGQLGAGPVFSNVPFPLSGGTKARLLARFTIDLGIGGVYAPGVKDFPADLNVGDNTQTCVYVVRLADFPNWPRQKQEPNKPIGTMVDVEYVAVLVPDGRDIQIHRAVFDNSTHPGHATASWTLAPEDDYMCLSCEQHGWCEVMEPLF